MADDDDRSVQAWLMHLDPQSRSDVEASVRVIRGVDPRLTQAIKWGRLSFSIDGNWHHWLCGITATSGSRLVFRKGALVEDPGQMLTGGGQYVRQLPLATVSDNPDAVVRLVRSAIAHETDSLD